MAEREKRRFPEWAEQERAEDMGWISENAHFFWSTAQQGYQRVGRGAIVVDTKVMVVHPGGVGHPSGYVEQHAIEQIGDEDSQRMVREYDPQREFVATLLKTGDRVSSYRLCVITSEARENIDNRVDVAGKKEATNLPESEPPDIETL